MAHPLSESTVKSIVQLHSKKLIHHRELLMEAKNQISGGRMLLKKLPKF